MQSWHSALHVLVREHPLWASLLPVKYTCHPVPISQTLKPFVVRAFCRLNMGAVSVKKFGAGGYGRKVGFVGELCTLQDYNPQNAMLTE